MASSNLTIQQIAIRSIAFYRWLAIMLALGVAAATATIVGALLVGDSVRGSLRHLVVDRLGRIEQVVLAPRYFGQAAVDRLAADRNFQSEYDPPVPAILFPKSTAERTSKEKLWRASQVSVIAIEAPFWKLGSEPLSPTPGASEVVLNRSLADELQAEVGDFVTLRIPREQAVPSDSPLGKRDELTESLSRLRVIAIIPDQGLGRFDLRTSQRSPRNAFVALPYIQGEVRRPQQINALLIARKPGKKLSEAKDLARDLLHSDAILQSISPTLEDMGLRVQRIRREFQPPHSDENQQAGSQIIYDYYHITSEQLLIGQVQFEAIQKALGTRRFYPVMTYLANVIEKVAPGDDPAMPVVATYSTMSAVEPHPELPWSGNSPTPTRSETTSEIAVGINQWLADRLSVAMGDRIRIRYYLPETVGGKEVEREVMARVIQVVPLTEPATKNIRNRPARFDREPTVFNDPELTPEVPGITDQQSISDWDLPFPLDPQPSREDDRYWEAHRLTPKIFMSLEDGKRLFGSRFGNVSSIRVPREAFESTTELEQAITPELQKVAAQQGFAPIPLRSQQLRAAQGTTPFDWLFLSLSFFVIVASLMLVSLLFRLGVEQRSEQWGLLLATGWNIGQVRRLLMRESMWIACLGALLGIIIGVGYAWAMIWALTHWWIGAISVAFLEFYVHPWSLFLGAWLGVLVTYGTIAWSSRSLKKISILSMLRKRWETIRSRKPASTLRPQLLWIWAPSILSLIAIGLLGTGWTLSGEARAGAFTGGGLLLLVAALIACYSTLSSSPMLFQHRSADVSTHRSRRENGLTMNGFASRSARRNPLRSTLAIGLVAIASFLVLSMSLFQAEPTDAAIGGFSLQASSSQPIPRDLRDPSLRREVLGPQAVDLERSEIFSFRQRPGDDASCNNLYQATEPQVIGVRQSFVDFYSKQDRISRFPFAASIPVSSGAAHPFEALMTSAKGTSDDPIPVILDQNTAMWSLHRGAKIGDVFHFEFDRLELHFQTVGLLRNTVLQGMLIIGEPNFERAFPTISGYQFFLVQSPSSDQYDTTRLLESGWGDEGLDATSNAMVLRQLLAVQNTYLRAFQSLGALGLLLGTIGLVVVQARTIEERKGELALLRAMGFTRARIHQALMAENAVLLFVGVAIGVCCTMVAVAPAWLAGQPLASFLGPLGLVVIVVFVGLIAGFLATWRVGRMPLLAALRGK